jgi:hypothetical protein
VNKAEEFYRLLLDLGKKVDNGTATALEALAWLDAVSNGNSIRDKATAIIKKGILAPPINIESSYLHIANSFDGSLPDPTDDTFVCQNCGHVHDLGPYRIIKTLG